MIRSNDDIDPKLFHAAQCYLRAPGEGLAPTAEQREAWRTFYQICDDVIRRYVATDRVPASELDDCVQEVWVYLAERLRGFEYDPDRGRFQTWLYTVVHSKAIDYFRRRRRRMARSVEWSSAADLPSDGAGPVESAERDESQQVSDTMLQRIRSHVSEENFALIRMRWVEGMTVDQTASVLRIKSEQVWYREHRLRKKLRKLFEEAFEPAMG